MTGMRRVIISSATSPSAGMSSEAIDGEEVLIGGAKCVANFAKVIPKLVSKLDDSFFVKKRPNKLSFPSKSHQNINLTRVNLIRILTFYKGFQRFQRTGYCR
jgi:hypothetical protein